MSGLEKDKKSNVRILWARSLSDRDIAGLLQMKLLEARVTRGTHVELLNELVHEIKHRLDPRRRGPDADER
jgi:hypothetical protein